MSVDRSAQRPCFSFGILFNSFVLRFPSNRFGPFRTVSDPFRPLFGLWTIGLTWHHPLFRQNLDARCCGRDEEDYSPKRVDRRTNMRLPYESICRSCNRLSSRRSDFSYFFARASRVSGPWWYVDSPLPLPCQTEERGIGSSRGEEEEDAQMCPCGKAVESRTHRVGGCERYKEERDVFLEEEIEENRRMVAGRSLVHYIVARKRSLS